MNPFKYGQIVSGNDFCPRPELEKQIKNLIQSGQNILVQGERRTGKSSLIYETVRKIKRINLLYVDLLEIKTVDNLCKRVVKAIVTLEQKKGLLNKIIKSISYLRPVISIDPITNQPTVSLSHDIQLQPDSLEEIFDLIKKINSEKPVAVVLDEFQDIMNLKEYIEIVAIIRGKIQFHSNIPYIFSGSIRNRMYDIFNNSNSPLFKSAITLDVGSIKNDQFIRYVREKFLTGKRTIKEDLLNRIFEMSEHIAGDIQQFCSAIWEITSYRETIKDECIGKALKLIFARESKSYEMVLTYITDLQLKCLTGLANMGGKAPLSAAFLKNIGNILPATNKKSLLRLEQIKIIYRKDGEYKFINPFFKLWLLSNNLL